MPDETRLDVYQGNGLVELRSDYDSFSEKTKNQLSTGFFSRDVMAEIQSALENRGRTISDSRNIDALVEMAKGDMKLRRKEVDYSDPVLQEMSQYLETARERIKQNLYELEEELPVGTGLEFNEPFIGTIIEKTPHLFISYRWDKYSNTGRMYYGPYLYTKFIQKKEELKIFGKFKSRWKDFDPVFDRMKKFYLEKFSDENWRTGINKILSFYLNVKTHVSEAQKQKKQEREPIKDLKELLMEEHNPIRE